jgi:hypothetical protein
MECPKCAATCRDDATECAHCGIVLAKFARHSATERAAVLPVHATGTPVVADPARSATGLGRGLVLAGLAVWTWQFARAPMGAGSDSILHLPNLVFHEAGHVLLGFFGRFIMVLGGSLFQFALPLILAAAFLRQRDPFGAVVCTWWAGQNLVDLAPYIADARALQLVLLGGKTGAEVEGHDWEYLLTTLRWQRFDRTLGLTAHRLGLLIMTGALVWGAVHLARNRDLRHDGPTRR